MSCATRDIKRGSRVLRRTSSCIHSSATQAEDRALLRSTPSADLGTECEGVTGSLVTPFSQLVRSEKPQGVWGTGPPIRGPEVRQSATRVQAAAASKSTGDKYPSDE